MHGRFYISSTILFTPSSDAHTFYNANQWDEEWEAYVQHKKCKHNPINLGQKDVNFDNIQFHQSINYFVSANRVHDYIGAKRKVTTVFDPDMHIILEKNPYFDSERLYYEAY